MSITLGSLTLHPHMVWTDEFAASEVAYSEVTTISGKLVRQTGSLSGGRPITLSGGHVQRSLLVQLKALQEALVTSVLTLNDSRTFNTSFADKGAIEVTPPVNGYHDPTDGDNYELTLHLIEVVS